METSNREPQEHSGKVIRRYLLEPSYSIMILLSSWGSLFGVPITTLLRYAVLRLTFHGLAFWLRVSIMVFVSTSKYLLRYQRQSSLGFLQEQLKYGLNPKP